MSVKSWMTSWSCRRSSPFLKMTGNGSPPSPVRSCSLSGKRFDLKTLDASASMPVTEMRASSGSGIGGEKVLSPDADDASAARSLSIFLGRASLDRRSDDASCVMRAMNSLCRRSASSWSGSPGRWSCESLADVRVSLA